MVLACAILFANREPRLDQLPDNRPIQFRGDGYVSSNACQACHPREHASWHDSYHRRMTQVASPSSVMGDFNDVSLELRGRSFLLYRDGEKFMVDMEVPGWRESGQPGPPMRVSREIVLTTGSHHMQVYWYTAQTTRMIAPLPFVFLLGPQKWVPSDASFLKPTPTDLPPEYGRWNTGCAKCHSTHPVAKIYDGRNMDTQVGEFGIACEACHGPGAEHIRRHSQPLKRYLARADRSDDPYIVNPADRDHRRSSQVCGHCHSVSVKDVDEERFWQQYGFKFRPGDELQEHRILVSKSLSSDKRKMLIGRDPHYLDDRFWSDGMVRVAGREG